MNSETRFNMSQKEMENSKFQKTGNSFTESYDSLKRKILDLEQRILDVAGIFNEENSKIQVVGDNKDELQELLKQKNKEISTKLSVKWIIILLIKKMKMLNYKKKLLI